MKASLSKALRMLRMAGDQGVTTGEFAEAGCPRFSARLAELRDAGYVVTTEKLASNRARYRLIHEPDGAAVGARHITAPSSDGTPSGKRRLVLLVDAKGPEPMLTGLRWEPVEEAA